MDQIDEYGIPAPVRVPPHSLDAESCVLGSMILDQDIIESVCDVISADDFFRPAHQAIFRTVADVRAELVMSGGGMLDLVLVVDRLKREERLEAVGGVEYLVHVAEGVPTSSNAMYYAGVVKDRAILRKIITTCNDLQRKAWSGAESGESVLSEWQQAASDLTGRIDVTKTVIDTTAEIVESAGKPRGGVIIGVPEIDYATGGLGPGNYFILAARPGRGKTTLALNVTANICRRGGAVLYVTREMTQTELVERMMCSEVRVSASSLRNGRQGEAFIAQLKTAKAEIDKWVAEVDARSATVVQVAAAVRRFTSRRKVPPSLLIIDYFQILQGKGGSRYEKFSEISTQLKAMAGALRIPVMALSQFNRPEKGKEESYPTMYQLKETGSLEQDADQVLLMHCPQVDHQGSNTVQLCLDKNRHGPEIGWGNTTLTWWPNCGLMVPTEYSQGE